VARGVVGADADHGGISLASSLWILVAHKLRWASGYRLLDEMITAAPGKSLSATFFSFWSGSVKRALTPAQV
jgi:hypothetical protein